MAKLKYSIIVSTHGKNPEIWRALLITSSSDAELIIADSNYDRIKANKFLYKCEYKQIVYVPIPYKLYGRDFAAGLNTALLYAEGEYIIRADDYLEFHPRFFEIADDDVKSFNNQIIIGQKAHAPDEIPWRDYFSERGLEPNKRFVNITDPRFTFSFGIVKRQILEDINGWDERYDMSPVGEDIDILHRLLIYTGKPAILDKKLMGYGWRHNRFRFEIPCAVLLYYLEAPEIERGRVKAFNKRDIKIEKSRALKEKEKFIL